MAVDEIRIDGLPQPDRVLFKNTSDGWSHTYYVNGKPRKVSRKQQRQDGMRATLSAMNHANGGRGQRPWDGLVEMRIIWQHSHPSKPDDETVISSIAGYRDGAQDAGLFHNDRQIRVRGVEYQRVAKGFEGVIITYRRVQEDPNGREDSSDTDR